jgi:hypothetical protein
VAVQGVTLGLLQHTLHCYQTICVLYRSQDGCAVAILTIEGALARHCEEVFVGVVNLTRLQIVVGVTLVALFTCQQFAILHDLDGIGTDRRCVILECKPTFAMASINLKVSEFKFNLYA